jgi:hypothetical protein
MSADVGMKASFEKQAGGIHVKPECLRVKSPGDPGKSPAQLIRRTCPKEVWGSVLQLGNGASICWTVMAPEKERKAARELRRPLPRKQQQRPADLAGGSGSAGVAAAHHGDQPSAQENAPPPREDRAG